MEFAHFAHFAITMRAGLAVRRACYGVMRNIMEAGAKGTEVIVSGKVGQQRAKAMKFNSGYMVKSGNSTRTYVDTAIRHLSLKQGVLGVKVVIMLPHDETGRNGPSKPMADVVKILEPKVGRGGGVKRDGVNRFGVGLLMSLGLEVV
jgi:small subunit ribosomal protein S3e